MVTAIICVVLGIICIIAVRTYAKNLAHGCCGGDGDSVKKIGSADSDKSHYPYEKLVKIEGMTCKNCAARVENAFHKLDGTCANVNLGKQQLTLLTKDEISDAEIKRIVAETGYLAKEIQSRENPRYRVG